MTISKSKSTISKPIRPKSPRLNSIKRTKGKEMETDNKKERKRSRSNNGVALPPLEISVAGFLNDSHYFINEASEKVYGLIFEALKQNRPVRLSYKGVEPHVLSFFSQTTVGKLYKKFKPKKIEELVEIVDATEVQRRRFHTSIRNYRDNQKLSRKQKREIEAILNGDYDF